MKRVLFSLIALMLTAFCRADPFAHLKDIPEQKPETVLAEKIIKNDTVTYCITTPDGNKHTNINEEDLDNLIRIAFKEWTYGIALRIRASGRAEEFKDVLAVLEKDINFKRLPFCDMSSHPTFNKIYPNYKNYSEAADITFIRSTNYCKDEMHNIGDFFSYDTRWGTPFICLFNVHVNMSEYNKFSYLPTLYTDKEKTLAATTPALIKTIAANKYTKAQQDDIWAANRLFFYDDEPTFFSVILHETGHAFGLADEYDNDDRDPYYSTKEHGEGLMRYSYGIMGCDEVDGMITLIDRFSDRKRTFTSFCKTSVTLENGSESKKTTLKEEIKKSIAKGLLKSATDQRLKDHPLSESPTF